MHRCGASPVAAGARKGSAVVLHACVRFSKKATADNNKKKKWNRLVGTGLTGMSQALVLIFVKFAHIMLVESGQ